MIDEHEVEAALEALGAREHLKRVQVAQRLREQAWRRSQGRALAGEVVRRGLEASDLNVTASAARLAGDIGELSVWGRLVTLAEDHRRPLRVRRAAASALGWVWLRGRVASADEPSPSQRGAALAALTSLSRHREPLVRRVAVEAAGRMEIPEALGLLCDAASDPAWQVRQDAALGLGGMRGEAAVEAWAVLARLWPQEVEARVAERALRSMAELALECASLHEATRQHLEEAAERVGVVRKAALRGLSELASP